jgi:predicted RNase H-like HicB family nuclease
MATKRKRTKLPVDLSFGERRRFSELNAIFFDDDGEICGFIEELLGVFAHGKNIDEARSRLVEAAETFLEGNGPGVSQRRSAYGTVTRERLLIEFTLKQ